MSKLNLNYDYSKDLQITNLEKEIKFLKTKNDQLKKENHQYKILTKKQKFVAEYSKKVKELKEKHCAHIETLQKASRKYREKMHKHSQREAFFVEQVKRKYGLNAYIEIMNHVDNPDRSAKFKTKENKENFYKKNLERIPDLSL